MAITRYPRTDEATTAAGIAIPEGGTARVIGMRDLQKITAATIAGLSGATPIESAGATIALLIPPSRRIGRALLPRSVQPSRPGSVDSFRD